ncbi:MAG: alpha/beta hydrolase [Bacteroidetes bacterium CG18_big_fil_WC_8_21_14_2_50_41_14]|nr:MAG: alpha/beta hydrolase [Bacteroidetes bacterium CG18_big_fil_WC_8_21_14_2_50_41_14]
MLKETFPGKTVTFQLTPDKIGQNIATLYVHPILVQPVSAVLYIHGFNDYFFQIHVADWFTSQGIQFFALDLRRYGRSLLPHQKPGDTHNIAEYFEEIILALNYIRTKKGIKNIALMGHSTGGLITSLYCSQFKDYYPVDALILNSPFFEFNMSYIEKCLLPVMAALGKIFPGIPAPASLSKGYGESIHKEFHGEWEFDRLIKPIEGHRVELGWVNAIYTAQRTLQKGLDIRLPILVMYAEKSVKPGTYREDMQTADSVLNVADIERIADSLGKQVTKKAIPEGMHDLMLSNKTARQEVFKTIKDFLQNKTDILTN